jgi:MSV199 domain-containing protein/T5orf172 domain-containing protein
MSLTKFNKDDLINIIKENDNLLSIKELLNKKNYEFNNLYIDKFYENIKDDKDIYVDTEMIKLMGFNRSEIKKNKQDYINILKDNFEENIDYKLINNKEFNESSKCQIMTLENSNLNTHNKVKHLLVSPDCFKQSLMLLRTNKSKEIRKYYIELEKIFKYYLEYQNLYKDNQLLLSEDKIIKDKQKYKLNQHKYLIEKFNNKRCVYIIEILENILIKIGSTHNIKDRLYGMKSQYNIDCIVLDIFECNDYREIERNILNNNDIKKNLYNEKINNIIPTEIIKLSEQFNFEQLLYIVKENINKIIFLSPVQQLENKKLDIEQQKLNLVKKLLENGYNPEILNNINININTNNNENINNNTINELNINENNNMKNEDININNNNDNNNDNININIDNIQLNIKQRKSRGRKIQKIDPNNFNNIIKIYNSMISLLRSNESINYNKSNIQVAIKENRIYRGYRWGFVEHDEDPNISKIGPTNENKSTRLVEPILKMNKEKTEIIEVYKTKELCAMNIGINRCKLKKIIINNELYNDNYYIKISDCNSEIINKYELNNYIEKNHHTNAKSIIQINPLTNQQIQFNTINDIYIKLGISENSIRDAIKNKQLWAGSYWKYNT